MRLEASYLVEDITSQPALHSAPAAMGRLLLLRVRAADVGVRPVAAAHDPRDRVWPQSGHRPAFHVAV